ncbi:hypothetical protein KOW79_014817 [Hemibagrus wyckioides]|uniref:Uncharacterized protein n=1 Tax=Hemibagrus wyckioides TaxID=337641 RepID=A0A9D3NHT8_9TELE|nr:hypothetical protein KOW79_014817 [Hemibagrus wyckioides]
MHTKASRTCTFFGCDIFESLLLKMDTCSLVLDVSETSSKTIMSARAAIRLQPRPSPSLRTVLGLSQFPTTLRDGVAHRLPDNPGCYYLRTSLSQALHVPKPVAITCYPLCQDGPALRTHSDRSPDSRTSSH